MFENTAEWIHNYKSNTSFNMKPKFIGLLIVGERGNNKVSWVLWVSEGIWCRCGVRLLWFETFYETKQTNKAKAKQKQSKSKDKEKKKKEKRKKEKKKKEKKKKRKKKKRKKKKRKKKKIQM